MILSRETDLTSVVFEKDLRDVLDRLTAIERELFELKLKLASMSTDSKKVEEAVKGYLALREEVSRKWKGDPAVLDEFRKGRERGCCGAFIG